MKQKMFVFDLDGTFLDSGKTISPRNRQAGLDILQRGDHLVFATARPPRYTGFIQDTFREAIFITINGAMYQTPSGHQVNITLGQDLLGEISDYVQAHDPEAVLSVMVQDLWYSSNTSFDFRSHYHVDYGPEILSPAGLKRLECGKILINQCGIVETIIEKFGSLCNISVTDGGWTIQIASRQASKENAVQHIAEELGLGLDDVICFGDDHNDMGLCRLSGISVAMANAVPELKAIAAYITGSNDEDGVAQWVEGYYAGEYEKQ